MLYFGDEIKVPDVTDFLLPDQTAHPMQSDETGIVFEIKGKDGERVTIMNTLVEKEMRDNRSLYYVRLYYRRLYDIQKNRIAAGNAQGAVERLTKEPMGELDWFYSPSLHAHEIPLPMEADMRIPHGCALYRWGAYKQDGKRAWAIDTGKTAFLVEQHGFQPLAISRIDRECLWIAESIVKRLADLERSIEKQAETHLDALPIYTEYLSKIKGVGTRLALTFIGIIVTPDRFPHAGKLRRYFGIAGSNQPKRQKGVMANWSAEGKVGLYKFSESIVKVRGGYRELYDQFKAREVEKNENRPEADRFSKGKVHAFALRKIQALFLSHLLETWKRQLGRKSRIPYASEYLEHTTMIPPFTDED